MTWVDGVICAVLMISIVFGALRGFTRETFSLATWVVAFWLAWRFGARAGSQFGLHVANQGLRLYLGYAVVFIVVLIVGAVISAILVRLVRSSPLAGADRSLGAGLGLLRGLLLVVAGIMLAAVNGERNSDWWRQSLIVPRLAPVAAELRTLVPDRWLNPLSAQHIPPSSASHTES